MTDIRSSRTRRVAVVGAAAVTVLAIGVATATALTPAPRVPAVVDPHPSASRSPQPSTSPSAPTPGPTPSAGPAAHDGPRWGVVDSLLAPPRPGWSVDAPTILAHAPGSSPTTFIDVLTGAPYGEVSMIRAGSVLVTSVTAGEGLPALAGIDIATGAVLWVDDTDEGGRTSGVCGGVTSEGLVACRAVTGGNHSAVDMVDPADGTVVRTVAVPFGVDSFGVAGNTIVAHGTTDRTTARWDGIDAVTGAALWSHAEPGASSDAEIIGDVFAYTRVDGHVARLISYGYQAVVDTRTGERIPEARAGLWSAVWAPGDGVVVPSFVEDEERDPDSAELVASRLHALDPVTGSTLWTYESVFISLAGVVGDGALVHDETSTVYLDLATGDVRWRIDGGGGVLATDGERILTWPDEGHDLTARSLVDGSEIWSLPGSRGYTGGSWIDPRHVVIGIDEAARMFAW